MRVVFLALVGLVAIVSSAHAQGPICSTANIPSEAPNCASEAFVTNHFPTSSVAGHVATFADTSGNILEDGGTSLGCGTGLVTTSGGCATGPGVDNNIGNSYTSADTAKNTDCGKPMLLGGDAQFTLTVNAANTYSTDCHLIIINVDVYSGAGSGRGKLIAASGISSFFLYPGQTLDLRAVGSSWISDQLISAFGILWLPATVPQFFTDTGGSDTANDGLASGTSGAFLSLGHCVNVAYSLVYTRNLGSIQCSNTAAQTQSPASYLQIFYPLSGGGTLQFTSATPGQSWNWDCPSANYCLQFGDGALLGLTDVHFVGNTSPAIILGHNHGVLDINTNVELTGNSAATAGISCDYDTHFNINNGLTAAGTFSYFFDGCQGSRWNINDIQSASGSVTMNRYFNFTTGSLAMFQGNVTFTGSVTASPGFISGNSVVNNLSGYTPFGGSPSTATGAQYCTSLC